MCICLWCIGHICPIVENQANDILDEINMFKGQLLMLEWPTKKVHFPVQRCLQNYCCRAANICLRLLKSACFQFHTTPFTACKVWYTNYRKDPFFFSLTLSLFIYCLVFVVFFSNTIFKWYSLFLSSEECLINNICNSFEIHLMELWVSDNILPSSVWISRSIIIIVLLLWEFFTPASTDGFPLESEWQQVSSFLQDSSQYSGRS